MAETVPIEHDIVRTYDLLGGDATIAKPVRNSLEAHELLLSGLPASSLVFLTDTVASLAGERVLEKAIGISLRTLQRRKKDARKALLSIDQSNRTWKFAEILGRAAEVFGSREEAEAWLMRPAIGLDQRRPIDLMATTAGIEAVEDYLTRMEYGVYA